ncbi:MAG: sodium:proton antiporter NhaD [Gammaproteobacteria bacterium]|nr:sodium:proton antiporter NhaD [Gammaproteobacteria bacterium]
MEPLNLVAHPLAILALILFGIAYILVMTEEYTSMRKSKPVLLCAGLIWGIVAYLYSGTGLEELMQEELARTLLDYAELLLFLLVAMTYINALEERRVFLALKAWIVSKGFSPRQVFWITGFLSFCISPFADNLTTALLMCAVIVAVGGKDKKFVGISCINIVVAANAGGAFSPFGDITTLMVWQAGKLEFLEFSRLFVPSLVNFAIPAIIMSFFIGNSRPRRKNEEVEIKRGANRIMFLFLMTILTSVVFHTVFHLPPAVGMMMGLSYLQFFGYFLRKSLPRSIARKAAKAKVSSEEFLRMGNVMPFDVFSKVAKSEWDTLIFFYGVVMCIGGLGFLGYLELLSMNTYGVFHPTIANSLVGIFSAVLDNIPVMFAVLSMDPDLSHNQWLLVTLTAGVGGSLLATGSAAGVALLGQARGSYTFFGHLKWSPVIMLGYVASILTHIAIHP